MREWQSCPAAFSHASTSASMRVVIYFLVGRQHCSLHLGQLRFCQDRNVIVVDLVIRHLVQSPELGQPFRAGVRQIAQRITATVSLFTSIPFRLGRFLGCDDADCIDRLRVALWVAGREVSPS